MRGMTGSAAAPAARCRNCRRGSSSRVRAAVPTERKAMALKKKRAAKRRAWNKGLEIGQRDAFTPAQVKRIRQVLAGRGVPGLRDLALFSVAIDTMLQGPELLNLNVKDVQLPNGTIRSIINVARTRRKPPVRCALSEATAKALGKWIAVSGKKRTGYIFSGRGAVLPRPMTVRQMNRLLKFWVAEAGLDPKKYERTRLNASSRGTPSAARASKTNAIFATG